MDSTAFLALPYDLVASVWANLDVIGFFVVARYSCRCYRMFDNQFHYYVSLCFTCSISFCDVETVWDGFQHCHHLQSLGWRKRSATSKSERLRYWQSCWLWGSLTDAFPFDLISWWSSPAWKALLLSRTLQRWETDNWVILCVYQQTAEVARMFSTQSPKQAQWRFGCFYLARGFAWCLDTPLQHNITMHRDVENNFTNFTPQALLWPGFTMIHLASHDMGFVSWPWRMLPKEGLRRRSASHDVLLHQRSCFVKRNHVVFLLHLSNDLDHYLNCCCVLDKQGIYDVSSSANFQPGSAYHFLAGADATIGLAMM